MCCMWYLKRNLLVSTLLLTLSSILFLWFYSSVLPYTTKLHTHTRTDTHTHTLAACWYSSRTSSIIPHRVKLPHLSIPHTALSLCSAECVRLRAHPWVVVTFCSSSRWPMLLHRILTQLCLCWVKKSEWVRDDFFSFKAKLRKLQIQDDTRKLCCVSFLFYFCNNTNEIFLTHLNRETVTQVKQSR